MDRRRSQSDASPVRAVVVVVVAAVGLAAGSGPMVGAAVGSHRAAASASPNAAYPSWSPDGKQILFGLLRFRHDRTVRTSSRPGGATHAVRTGGSYVPMFWAPGGRIVFGDDQGNWGSVGMRGGKAKPIVFPT